MLIYPLWIVLSGIVGLCTIFATASDTTEKAVDRSFALLLIAALLISPLGWTYYLFFLFAPLCSVAIDWWKQTSSSLQRPRNIWGFYAKKTMLIATIPGFIVPMYHVAWFQPNPIATLSLGSIYFWCTLFLWISLIIDWKLENRGALSFFRSKDPHSFSSSPLENMPIKS